MRLDDADTHSSFHFNRSSQTIVVVQIFPVGEREREKGRDLLPAIESKDSSRSTLSYLIDGGSVKSKQTITPIQVKAFDTVVDLTREIKTLIENQALMTMSGSRMTLIDYWICVWQVVEGTEDKGIIKNFIKVVDERTVGVGSRNLLILTLARKFVQAGLFPRQKFFASTQGWKDSKRRNTIVLPQTPKSQADIARLIEEIERDREPRGVRRWTEEGAPLVVETTPTPAAPEDNTGIAEVTVEESVHNIDAYFERNFQTSDIDSGTTCDTVASILPADSN